MNSSKLISHISVDSICDSCGEGIEEEYFTNDKGQPVHVSTSTNGHYYSDGTAHCESCHDGHR
jgi:hypothetical protein